MEAVNELRPLVDKLILPPEEKFDVYLLLIRCTDDRTLVAPAHETARMIEDETRRATALLDTIKEIDYLSAKPGLEENSANIASPIDNQPLLV
jgi:bifunctional phosphoglucose/phosphomannose isomerase